MESASALQGLFLFTFVPMANWKFYLDGNEVEEPIGWDAIEFTAIRMESHGIDQPFSTEVRFYNQGAKYIKNIFDQYFINQPIAITITSDVGVNNVPYQFDGFLNLAIYQEHNVCDTDSWEITVGIIDDNFREDFKARQDVQLDLTSTTDLNGDTIDPLTFKNIRLHRQDLYLVANGKSFDERVVLLNWFHAAIIPIYWQQSDFNENYGSTFNTNLSRINWNAGQYGQSPIFKNNLGYTRYFEADYNLDVTITNNNTFNAIDIRIYFIRVNGNVYTPPAYFLLNTTLDAGATHTWNLSSTISNIEVPAGYTVNYAIEAGYTGNPYTAYVSIANTVRLKWSELNSGEYASTANVLTIEQWLRRSIYLMTGSNDKLLSDCFSESGEGCYWNNALTNGIRIRQAEANAGLGALSTSWKQVFEGLDNIFCLGWAFEWTGSEWKIRVEPREYFYQNTISQTFANVGEIDQMAKVDGLYNNITLGYSDKWKNIQLSGAFAIHTDRNYFVDNRAMNEASSAKLDIRSQIIAEGYAIEFSRRLSDITYGGGSSDRPNDYETFIIWLTPFIATLDDIEGTCFNLPQETGTVSFAPGELSMPSSFITSSSSILENLYNIYHTPARVGFRWWKQLGMNTYGVVNPKLRFQVGQYQTIYSSQISDTAAPCQELPSDFELSENANIDPSVMNEANNYYLFKPIQVEFSYPQSLCDFIILSNDEQYQKVKLTSGSLSIEGFIKEAANQPEDASGGTTKFTLLMSAQEAALGGAFTTGFDTGYENG